MQPPTGLEVISRGAAGRRNTTPLLFVHGAWHAAWCWDRGFLQFFADRGYAVHALSLRGHGRSLGRERLRWTRLAEYVRDVAAVAARCAVPPVVIGHSMGGGVVQKYLETHDAPAAVLMAPMPSHGVLGTTLRIHLRHTWRALRMHAKLSLLPLVETPDIVGELFFSRSTPRQILEEFTQQMQDESYCAFLDMLMLNLPRPRRVQAPMLVLGAQEDAIFTPGEVQRTASAYGTDAVMFPGMAHDMMLEPGWERVAAYIERWLRGRSIS